MRRRYFLGPLLLAAPLFLANACGGGDEFSSSDGSTGGTSAGNAGGSGGGNGVGAGGKGGAVGQGGTTGGTHSAGGSTPGAGGSGQGGKAGHGAGQGGSSEGHGAGGTSQGTGGSPQGTGGAPEGAGGSPQGTGGSPQGTGGSPQGTGGSPEGPGAGGSQQGGPGAGGSPEGVGGGGTSSVGGEGPGAGGDPQGQGGAIATGGSPLGLGGGPAGAGGSTDACAFDVCEAASTTPPPACGACTVAICATLPECCDSVWDASCAIAARKSPACGCPALDCATPKEDPAVALCGDAIGSCNPVSGHGCSSSAMMQCGLDDDSGQLKTFCSFVGDIAACGTCSTTQSKNCLGGLSCILGTCVRPCCDDAQCTSGKCDHNLLSPNGQVGVCVQP